MSQNYDSEFNKLKNPPRNLHIQQGNYDDLLQRIEEVDIKPNFWPRLQYPLILIATCFVLLITVLTLSPNNNSEKPYYSASMGLEGVSSQQIESIYTLGLENNTTNNDKFYGKRSKAYINVQKVTDPSYIHSIITHIQNNEKAQIDNEQLSAIADLIIVVKGQEIKLKIFENTSQELFVQNWETREMFQLNDLFILEDLMKIEEQNNEWRDFFIALGLVLVFQYLIKTILIRVFNMTFPKVRVKQSPFRIIVSIVITVVALSLINIYDSNMVAISYFYFGAYIALLSSIDLLFGWRLYKENGVLLRNILQLLLIPVFLIIMVIVK
ncbi:MULTISPECIES: hypothetical protein [unclassified Viridibacillus]|uniref:hypothetical protein n=1 Tax=unclassified Viridibacillus TaxID=2617942 RepID=UPI00096CD513|nr:MULTISPECIES: hypothetical protein [unclassified Viridibacillus]OMC82714.1 hypothetical protein BK128_19990 [Viridibacillus sp. FSL H7-0596]OMC84695.1 hypothetical protein BK130_03510 [Viridibacillus sp. FSL H8-0123]